MKKLYIFFLFCLFSVSCSKNDDYNPINKSSYENGEELSVGKLTTRILGGNAFDQQVPGLPKMKARLFFVGNSLFRQNWVSAPASTKARDGLGPTFNARACSACHNKDGRGTPLLEGQEFSEGFLMRVSLAGTDAHGGPKPVPNYGDQIQDHANLGVKHEAKIKVQFKLIKGKFADGESYELRKPIYTIYDEKYGSLQSVLTSPRVGQQVIGLGLIDAIATKDILANADENDSDKDGISGKPNYVWNVKTKATELGRFGWKANQPNLRQQVAAAFIGDMGLTSSLFPNQNCTSPQQDCYDAPNGGSPEITDEALDDIMIYSSSLSVPIRRGFKNPDVLEGKELFRNMKCNSCHVENFTTSSYSFNKTLENVKIRPFSDFLLHDMGKGLADNRPDFKATGREWRTQPLWGIGLLKEVSKHTFLLHDGRARNVKEAILWHGGEAEKAKNQFKKLTKKQRASVVAFVNSL